VGENLDEIERSPSYFAERLGYLRNLKLEKAEIIRPRDDPFGTDGGVAVLYGNLAPGGAMIKAFSVPAEMHVHTGPARVFDFEDEAVHALVGRKVTPGDVLVIRYEGPRANGMPEMYYASAILSADAVLNTTTAIVTDGRYSGAMSGPCVGHVSPEALEGGPIALVEEGDLIEINIPERRLAIVGTGGEHQPPETIDARLAQRRRIWKPPRRRHDTGILSLYERVARSAAEGASIT
jgi:dihydroxy-acid dehydratase